MVEMYKRSVFVFVSIVIETEMNRLAIQCQGQIYVIYYYYYYKNLTSSQSAALH